MFSSKLLNLSPPIGSRARKFISAYKTWDYNEEVVKEMDIHDAENPVWESVGNVISAATNVPFDRLINKTKNISEALKASLISEANLFLMPSRIEKKSVEGFGISFIEAAAYGIGAIGG